MTSKHVLIAAVAAVLVVGAIGCSRGRSDAQIIGEVVTKINADPKISEKQISVMSSNGVVTLSGAASTEEERAQAANDAAQVEGVKTVVNNLLIAAPPSLASELAPAEEEKPEAQQPPPPPKTHKPSAYHRRKPEPARVVKTASDMPIVSSGPPVTTASTSSMPPMPASVPAQTVTPAPPPPPQPVTIESGTILNIRMIDPVDTATNRAGDSFRATLDSPIMVGDKVVIPQGADVVGRIAELKNAGKFAGQPQLALELASLSVNGRKYTLHTNQYMRQGRSRGSHTAKTVGTGAAIGAIIGAIAGGGKGAAIGAAAGAGVGGGVEAAGKAEHVRIESEALLAFRLESPITVTPTANARRNRNYYNGSYSAPPPSDNYDDVIDYSDSSTNDSNRPVLRRRTQTSDRNQN